MNASTDRSHGSASENTGTATATVLRLLGAGATVFGALIFMLQGFEHIELAWRPWFYLGFISLLAGGGAASLYLFKDARGARMFLGLATALVPVQFTQLGGMLYALLHEAPNVVPGIFVTGAISPAQIAAVAAVSIPALVLVSWAGFAGLVRSHARTLWLPFLAACTLLLVPERASAAGMAVIASLGGLFLWLELQHFRNAPAFATWEGWAVRCMFLLPLCIAAVRASFYAHDLAMLATLFGVVGGLLLLLIRSDFRPWIAESLRAVASTCLVIAWLLLAVDLFTLSYAYLWFAVIFPTGLVLVVIGHFATGSGPFYRWLGLALIALGSYALIDVSNGLVAWLAVLTIGVAMCALGAYYAERTPIFVGATQTVIALFGTVIMSLRAVDVDTWLVLAVLGIVLVLASSVAERYGLARLRRRFTRLAGDSTARAADQGIST